LGGIKALDAFHFPEGAWLREPLVIQVAYFVFEWLPAPSASELGLAVTAV